MKLVLPHLSAPIRLEEERPAMLVVEHPGAFSRLLLELKKAERDEPSEIGLFQDAQELSFSRRAELIVDPFALDVNQRRILNAVYSQLEKTAVGESCYCATATFSSQVQAYLEQLLADYSYDIAYASRPELPALFKVLGVHLNDHALGLPERIDNYMMAASEFLRKEVFVFVNLQAFLTWEELSQLCRQAAYRKLRLLFVEPRQREKLCAEESVTILDADLCELRF